MTMPNMGHIVASKYNVMFVHVSMQQCSMFLPLLSTSFSILEQKIISIGFVNNNHFVEVIS